jgi:anti-anti-sigma factor
MTNLRLEWQDGSHEGERVVKLTGALTLASIVDFQEEIRRTPPDVTIVDLSGVQYMDSAALGSLLGFHVSCHNNRRKYALIGVGDRLQTLMTVSGIGGVLIICESLAAAEQHLYGGTTRSASGT